tara:strand:+ start:1862 stop:2224 length:363 start_codon:yes stop_codon:yes gene_type:complete
MKDKIPNKKIYIGDEPKFENPTNPEEEIKKEEPTEGEYQKPPSLKTQLVSFAKAFTGWIKEGAPVVTPKEFADRIITCHVCDKFNKRQNRCMECGCMVEYKARMKTSECPLNKWDKDAKE